LQRYLNTHVYHGTVHNSQITEAAYLLINGRMDKENVVYIHNEFLFSLQEE
jgi:hypothetical protein